MIRFKTAFIKMTRDPTKFAQTVEHTLNDLAADGWTMSRFDFDMKKGVLIVAHRAEIARAQKPGEVTGEERSPLAVLLGLGTRPVLSDRSSAILHQIAGRMDSGEGPSELRLERAVAAVCLRFPSAILRQAANEIKEQVRHHRQHEHQRPEEECPQSDELEAIARELEKQVAKSVV